MPICRVIVGVVSYGDTAGSGYEGDIPITQVYLHALDMRLLLVRLVRKFGNYITTPNVLSCLMASIDKAQKKQFLVG